MAMPHAKISLTGAMKTLGYTVATVEHVVTIRTCVAQQRHEGVCKARQSFLVQESYSVPRTVLPSHRMNCVYRTTIAVEKLRSSLFHLLNISYGGILKFRQSYFWVENGSKTRARHWPYLIHTAI